MSIASRHIPDKSSFVHNRYNPPKPARWTARPKGQPVDGAVWGWAEILDPSTAAWGSYALIIRDEGEELVLEPSAASREAGHRRVTLCGGGSECSCGESDPKHGCIHQRALRILFQSR